PRALSFTLFPYTTLFRSNGHVTGMVGVPALWELLHRRIKNRLHERSKMIGDAADFLMKINAWVRDNTPLNLGQLVFYPIHEGLGDRKSTRLNSSHLGISY